jgi:hypothetical protein
LALGAEVSEVGALGKSHIAIRLDERRGSRQRRRDLGGGGREVEQVVMKFRRGEGVVEEIGVEDGLQDSIGEGRHAPIIVGEAEKILRR